MSRLAARGSDERLARLVARDGQAPFAVLYERYHQALYRYCRSILRDEHDAQDALQNAMANAFAALRKGERDLAVRPWLFRIAHNESVSLLRRRRPREMAADELTLTAPADTSEPALVIEQRERLTMLLSDLRGLTIRQRSVLVMRELSGLSIAEIAQACSTTQGAVKQTLFEAREALRESERGRSMGCEQVRRLIYEEDRRALRGRRLRSHLRACAGCRELAEAITARRQDLRLLAPPLPPVAAAALLSHLLDSGAGLSAGTAASGSAAAGATQAATAGSGGTGAAAGSAGSAAAGSTASGVVAHASATIAAKVLATAAVLALGTAGVVGVTSSGTARHAGSTRGGAAHHAVPRSAAGLGQPTGSLSPPAAGGRAKQRAAISAEARRAATSHAGNLSQSATPGHDQKAASEPKRMYRYGSAGEAHESRDQSTGARGKAKTHPSAGPAGRSHGHEPRSKHTAHSNKPSGKGKPEDSASHREHAAHEPTGQGKTKPSKEAGDARGSGQPATTSGTPLESNAGSGEAPSGEHGKAGHHKT